MNVPPEIVDTWDFLNGEVVWLHGRWDIYRKLYGTNEGRIEALNRVAPTSFWIFQNMLLDDVQLALSRLGDPAGSGKRQNLTLERLANDIAQLGYADLSSKLRAKLAQYRAACGDILDRRNKRIAHSDLHQSATSKLLTQPSRAEIEGAMSALRAFMNEVANHFGNTEIAYEWAAFNDDGNHILQAIGHAIRYRELRDEGKISLDDYPRSDIYRRMKSE